MHGLAWRGFIRTASPAATSPSALLLSMTIGIPIFILLSRCRAQIQSNFRQRLDLNDVCLLVVLGGAVGSSTLIFLLLQVNVVIGKRVADRRHHGPVGGNGAGGIVVTSGLVVQPDGRRRRSLAVRSFGRTPFAVRGRCCTAGHYCLTSHRVIMTLKAKFFGMAHMRERKSEHKKLPAQRHVPTYSTAN